MNIVVCIKRVPATDIQVKVAADGKSLDPAGVEFVLNPYDEFAVQQALLWKEQQGGKVTVITLGGSDAQKDLRTCLAMGADEAVLVRAGDVRHDAYSTAEILAGQIKGIGADVVLLGKQAVDSDNSQTGPRIAELLGLPCVCEVSELELGEGSFTAARDIEGGREHWTCPLPAVITCNKGLNEPKPANLKGIMAAKKKPLREVDPEAIEPASTVVSLTLPPPRSEGRILGEGPGAVGALIEALRNEVKIL